MIVDEALVRDWGAVLHHRDSTLRQLRDRLSRAVYFATPRAHGSCSIRGQGAATVGTLLVLVRIAAGSMPLPAIPAAWTSGPPVACYPGDSEKNASGSSCAEVARNFLTASGGRSALGDTLRPGGRTSGTVATNACACRRLNRVGHRGGRRYASLTQHNATQNTTPASRDLSAWCRARALGHADGTRGSGQASWWSNIDLWKTG